MGRAKTGAAVSEAAETTLQDGGNGAEQVGGDATEEFVVAPYEVPTWAEFRSYVMDNGNKYVRATYPNPPVDLIETIWCGVPVEHHEQARVMDAQREWLVY